ncbi:MAG TPA: toll/interleukin-1 receptor domain-containing protein [Pyrinomonadaceae bacterium]
MHDIFVSYKSSDRERVRPLVELFERQGWSVWWDQEIPPGKTFDEFIEESIAGAKCVLVVWSLDSVKSNWVRTEAAEGVSRGIMVPVLIDDVTIPLAFRQIQAQRLDHASPAQVKEALAQLLPAVAAVINKPQTGVEPGLAEAVWKALQRKRDLGRIALIAAAASALTLLLAAAFYNGLPQGGGNTREGASPQPAATGAGNSNGVAASPTPSDPPVMASQLIYYTYRSRDKAVRFYIPVTFTREGFIDRMEGRLESFDDEGHKPALAVRTSEPPGAGEHLLSPIQIRRENNQLTYSVEFPMSEAFIGRLTADEFQRLNVDFKWTGGATYRLGVCFPLDSVADFKDVVRSVNLEECSE